VTAQVPLLGGLRHADLVAGTTLIEVKNGRLDQDTYLAKPVDQMITYPLLAHHGGPRVTHVALYAVRYQRLFRFHVPQLLSRLAGGPIDIDAASESLANATRASRHPAAADEAGP
jgi:hypothetical protein